MFRERNQEAPGSTHSPPCSHRTDRAEVPKVWVSEERRGVLVLFFFFLKERAVGRKWKGIKAERELSLEDGHHIINLEQIKLKRVNNESTPRYF